MHRTDVAGDTKENGPANVIKKQNIAGKNFNSSRVPFGRIDKNAGKKIFMHAKGSNQRGARKALGSIKNLQSIGNVARNLRATGSKQGGKLTAKENVENVEEYPKSVSNGTQYSAYNIEASVPKFFNNLSQGMSLKKQVVDVDETPDCSTNRFSAGIEDEATLQLLSNSGKNVSRKDKTGILGSLISDLSSDLSDLSSDEDD